MKTRPISRLLMLLGVLLVVGLACGGTTGGDATTAPADNTAEPATKEATAEDEVSTKEPDEKATDEPTEEPASEAPAFFVDETFDDLSNWSYFLTSGDEEDMTISNDDGVLRFDLQGKNVWVYLLYDPYNYKNVRIDGRADNRGKNNNNVSLICRYSDEGWYEFNIANNGLWWILAYTTSDDSYHEVYTGGSKLIKSGKEVNEYGAICNGRSLSLLINGTVVKEVEEKKYDLRDGQVGIGVSSFETLPIIVEWTMISISEP